MPAVLIVAFRLPHPNNQVDYAPHYTDTSLSPLVLYGKYIYQRENCNRCHILQDDTSNTIMVSLDGIGGEKSAYWHYRHIQDPPAMVMDSKMPAFPGLYAFKLEKSTLSGLYVQQGEYPGNIALLFNKLQQEADVILKDLASSGIAENHKEIIALIAYLQQISPSQLHLYKDSLWQAALDAKSSAWDNFDFNPGSTIMKYANSKDKKIAALGQKLFKANCFVCHGKTAGGGVGPNLTDDYWLHGSSSRQIMESITNGIPDKGMQMFKYKFTPEEIGLLTAFIHSVNGTRPANAKAPQGSKQ